MMTRRHQGRGTIRKLSSGRWQVRYTAPTGEQLSGGTYPTMTDAELWLSRNVVDISDGLWLDPSAATVLFKVWATTWLATSVDMRPSTRARDAAYLKTQIMPTFGELELGDITHLSVRSWVAKQSETLKPATVKKALQILSKILDAAVSAAILRTNPAAGVPSPRIEDEEMRFLTMTQVDDLADAMDKRFRALVLLGCHGGLRLGELLGLRGRHVNAAERSVEVAEILQTISGVHDFRPPKTAAGRRIVPVPATIADELADHLERYSVGSNDLVFAAPAGGAVQSSSWRPRFWHPAVASAGLTPLRPHDMRHTAVAIWIAHGLEPFVIAKRAGHRSVSTVLDRYGHLLPGAGDAATKAIDDAIKKQRQT